jgi:serine/threonine protein kinase
VLDPNDSAEETASPNWFLHEHLTQDVPSDTFVPAQELFKGDEEWPAEVFQANRHPRNRFGRFILVTQIGCGASGSVFRAWDTRWKQYAGLKILHEMTPEVLETFIREAARAARLRHPSR